MKKNRKNNFKEGDPSHFSYTFKWILEFQLRLHNDVKYLRWYKDESYLRLKAMRENSFLMQSEETIDNELPF